MNVREQVGDAKYEDMRGVLNDLFSDERADSRMEDEVVDDVIDGLWSQWDEQIADDVFPRKPPGYNVQSTAGESTSDEGIVGYHLVRARHERTGLGGHAFEGLLPMVHVVLPQRGQVNIETEIGKVDIRGVLFGSVEIMNQTNSATKSYRPAARVELITPPRLRGRRFAAIAVYLLYDNAEDSAPSAYFLEAGLARGGPRVTFYGPDINKPIPTSKASYKPSPMASPENWYAAGIKVSNGRLTEFWVNVLSAKNGPAVVAVNAVVENRDANVLVNRPFLIRARAAARVAAVAEAMGIPIGNNAMQRSLAQLLASIGRNHLDWDMQP
jgi:hypothetical protein